MSLEAEDHALKSNRIVWIVHPISSEMDVETTATQLRTKIAARQQLISAEQHMNAAGQAGQGLEAIQLVGKTASTSNFRKVLSLINQHRRGRR